MVCEELVSALPPDFFRFLPKSGAADGKTGFVSLAAVATLNLAPGPNQISREDGKRLVVVSANVRGRDIGSFVSGLAGPWRFD